MESLEKHPLFTPTSALSRSGMSQISKSSRAKSQSRGDSDVYSYMSSSVAARSGLSSKQKLQALQNQLEVERSRRMESEKMLSEAQSRAEAQEWKW